ncbi:MAG TPA: HNH endonuclease domain-containing protein [Ignavibacteria bacterium]|nr:HNH endonuclease domain-containing protein [Ignavibacteria bacterium]HMR41876.1 HNH endonuclease domain-containing protein [Ignavibacteria bacterium]
MKKILGLDLGTNSIGWALIEKESMENNLLSNGKIIASGSRIIPMSQDVLGKFDSGVSVSQTAERTNYRGIRRLRERHLLRRERLHRVLNILGFLPPHYSKEIDFEKKLGQFLPEKEPKIAYRKVKNKSEFIFEDSFNEMIKDFEKHQPQLLKKDNGDPALIPYDWTIYYLRTKALNKKIGKEELSWILLNFNQKRGYYQLREDQEQENENKISEYFSLKVVNVTADDAKKGKSEIWYSVHLENGWIYRRSSKVSLADWIGKTKEFIVSWELNDDNTIKKDKEGNEKRSFRAVDSEKDWIAIKKSTEERIERSKKTVGNYIYDTLLQKPSQKINGKLVRVIERKFYKKELEKILDKQKEFHQELQDEKIYSKCLEELYEFNESHRNNIIKKDFTHLFLNDIIFYQRPLKSKKSLISNCKFESRIFIKDGIKEISPIKCIAKSHPLFQEFRLWQFLKNLKIIEREKNVDGKLQFDVDVTNEFLKTEDDKVKLFEWLNEKEEIDQKSFLRYPGFKIKKNAEKFRWNYLEDKSYPMNETRSKIQSRLNKVENIPDDFLTKEVELKLWNIFYSIEDKSELKQALKNFANKNSLDDNFTDVFLNFPRFKKEYGSFSFKAIKKILPLMRLGKYWDENNIDPKTKERIQNIISAVEDETIRERVRDNSINLSKIEDFRGLPTWLISYIVYNRHSEDEISSKWKTPNDIELIKQHGIRNPIVEQVINETLMVVRDIWKKYGNSEENFFDEIHIELGREMKNPKDKRERMTKQINENENTNLRLKCLLIELLNDSKIENVRPHSPMQLEILKIYEEGALSSTNGDLPDDILKISKTAYPTSSELMKYKLWMEQKYVSPYTGQVIPLSKLFTRAYDIEHIIPQSRYFDDSFSNKVICESEINIDKGNETAYEYIKSNSGKSIELSQGGIVNLFTTDQYENFVNKFYFNSRGKLKKLLMDDIPESFIQRQLNDSRYISKVMKSLMSNIVKEKDEQESISKNVIVLTGAVTSKLKQDWELNNVWNEIIYPRFERLNELTNSNLFGDWTMKDGKKVFQTQIPIEMEKGFSKKRIDHRHHALDAITIACATRDHVNYLSNESALGKDKKDVKEKRRYDLRNNLCFKKYNDEKKQNYNWIFKKPWESFTEDAGNSISGIIVSFKQNLRVINKTINWYQKWQKNHSGEIKKTFVKQEKGENWAIRKPMHKETVSGLVNLKFTKTVSLSNAISDPETICDIELRTKIKELISEKYDKKQILSFFKELNNVWKDKDISNIDVFYFDDNYVASRKSIDESFNSSKIEQITDTGIQTILKKHLSKFNKEINGKITEQPELAFSADGIEEMNKNIFELNGNVKHKPIYKVRIFEKKNKKFIVGITGNKKDKYVEAATGTNLYFGIYQDENGIRSFETIPFNVIVEHQKQGTESVPLVDNKGNKLLFYLSPDDHVYVPKPEEIEKNFNDIIADLNNFDKNIISDRIYKVVKFTGNQCYFIQTNISSLILPYNSILKKGEFGSQNCSEKTVDNSQMVKHCCVILNFDRLGNLK